MSDASADLRSRLTGADDVIDKLSPDEAQLLVDLLTRKLRTDAVELDRSLEEAMAILPRMVRIPARKILFGR